MPTIQLSRSAPTIFCISVLYRAADTSDQVINLNTNTAFKCVPHILGNLQLLQTVAELCADAHYYFAHSLNSHCGSKASSMCPVRRALTPWSTRVGLSSSKTILLPGFSFIFTVYYRYSLCNIVCIGEYNGKLFFSPPIYYSRRLIDCSSRVGF